MKINIDKISHSAPIIWNIMEVVSWLCVISRLQKLLFSYLKTTLWRGADSCRDALVDNSCSLDGNSIPTNVTSSWLLSLRHSAPPRALRVELMSLISEVCSVVREAKNSPGSSSFCAAERLTFRCRPPLTWMEVKKTFNSPTLRDFRTKWLKFGVILHGGCLCLDQTQISSGFQATSRSPFVLVISGFCCSFRLNTTNNQQGEMLRLKAVRAASCGLPFRSFAQPKLAHTPHHPWRNYRLWLHAKIETRGGL